MRARTLIIPTAPLFCSVIVARLLLLALLCAGIFALAHGECASREDTWDPGWGDNPSTRCLEWSRNSKWGALKGGSTLQEACAHKWAQTSCAKTCCVLHKAAQGGCTCTVSVYNSQATKPWENIRPVGEYSTASYRLLDGYAEGWYDAITHVKISDGCKDVILYDDDLGFPNADNEKKSIPEWKELRCTLPYDLQDDVKQIEMTAKSSTCSSASAPAYNPPFVPSYSPPSVPSYTPPPTSKPMVIAYNYGDCDEPMTGSISCRAGECCDIPIAGGTGKRAAQGVRGTCQPGQSEATLYRYACGYETDNMETIRPSSGSLSGSQCVTLGNVAFRPSCTAANAQWTTSAAPAMLHSPFVVLASLLLATFFKFA